MRCSYDSHKIFAMYPQNEDILTNYLMLSTCLRNFFMNHIEYDYEMKALYESMKSIPMTQAYPELMSAAYRMVRFKGKFHKGIDCYADYVERYRKGIEALLPITGAYGEMFYDAEDVEIGVLSHLVSLGRLAVAFEDGKMIARLRNARNTLAHIKPMTQAEIDEIL